MVFGNTLQFSSFEMRPMPKSVTVFWPKFPYISHIHINNFIGISFEIQLFHIYQSDFDITGLFIRC